MQLALFFVKQKESYAFSYGLVGSMMCIMRACARVRVCVCWCVRMCVCVRVRVCVCVCVLSLMYI